MTANRGGGKLDVTIARNTGSDGRISCLVITKPMLEDPNAPDNAKEGVDYVAKQERVVFENGETEKTVEIELLNPPTPESGPNEAAAGGGQVKEGEEEEEHEELNLMFKVRIEAAEPS